MFSDDTTEVELGGCSNEPELELGSTVRVGSDEVELGEGRVEAEGEGSIATSDSVAVDVTIVIVVKADLLTISGVAVISIDAVS